MIVIGIVDPDSNPDNSSEVINKMAYAGTRYEPYELIRLLLLVSIPHY